MNDTLPEHLGGHLNKVHVDRGPLLYMRDKLDCRTMVDIGCGPGWQVKLAKELGYKAYGVDGDWTVLPDTEDYMLHDFTEGKVEIDGQFDLAWSVEFLEHVEEEYLPNFMSLFGQAKYAIVTHAPPGANGHHHVNCQTAEYWIDQFSKYGMEHDEALTEIIKDVSVMKKPFIKRTGLVFRSKSS